MITNKKYRDRALALANMLEANPYRHRQRDWGKPKEKNPCGTTACLAGWSQLAKRGIVTIELDGTMTYDEANLGRVGDQIQWRSDLVSYSTAERQVPTLWRAAFGHTTNKEGQEWLGLSDSLAYTLFVQTADSIITNKEAVALELLRRLADGRLSRRRDDVSWDELDRIDKAVSAAAGGPVPTD